MKLIFCPKCEDVLKLLLEKRTCHCGASWGHYEDDLNAVIGGKAVPLGFSNDSVIKALKGKTPRGRFNAFVIDLPCKTIRTEEHDADALDRFLKGLEEKSEKRLMAEMALLFSVL